MTTGGASILKAALVAMRSCYSEGADAIPIIDKDISDIDALVNGAGGTSKFARTFKVVPTVTAGELPLFPGVKLNDEAVVTDATVLTNATVVVGGGANRVMVRFDGTNWNIV